MCTTCTASTLYKCYGNVLCLQLGRRSYNKPNSFLQIVNLFTRFIRIYLVPSVGAFVMSCDFLVNPSKTEFLFMEIKLQREKNIAYFPCLILGQDTNPSASAKNLGVVFDSSLNFRKHIILSQTCRACFYYIRDLRRIRKQSVLRSGQGNCSGTRQ